MRKWFEERLDNFLTGVFYAVGFVLAIKFWLWLFPA